MRKILSLVLVLSMVLGSFGFAFAAPADVEGTDYEDAVTRLIALEIVSGYDDGEFKPEKTITRAEFAKIMIHAVGVGESAQYSKGATAFSDVPAGHWASGYINQAAGMEIINGRGDGTFGPEDKVTYAQAVTMIVRALGYEPKAQAMGGYPNGYLAVAAEEDITDDISFADASAATRGDVAKMVDASLDVNLMYQATWGDTPEYKNDDDDKTLLKTKLHIDEIEGVVTAVPNIKSSLKDNEIEVDSEDDGTDIYELLIGDVNLDTLLGLEVTIWADDDQIVNLEVDTDEDNIKFDTIVKEDSDDEVVYLYVDDEEYDWAKNAEVYVNFDEEKVDEIPADAYGYFVLNDDDEVVYANLFDFNEVEAGVVFDIEDDEYEFVDRTGDEETLDLEDYDDGVFVYNEKFEVIDIDDVDVNSAIYAWNDDDELYLVVKNTTVSGELEGAKNDEVEIDGEDYDKAYNGAAYSDDEFDSFEAYNVKKDLEDINGEEVTAVLDLNDEVQLIFSDTKATSATKYGVVTYAELGSKPKVSIAFEDAEGEVDEEDYYFDDRDDARKDKALQVAEKADTWYDSVKDGLAFVVTKFKLNKDGDIDSEDLEFVLVDNDDLKDEDGPALQKGEDKDTVYLVDGNKKKKFFITKDTVFMTALDSDGDLDPDSLSYDSVYEAEFNAEKEERAIVIGEEGRDADLIVFIDKDFESVDDDVYFAVVTDDVEDRSGDDYVKMHVYGESKEERYKIDEEKDFRNGDIVAYNINNDDEATIDDDYDDSYLEDTNVKFEKDDDNYVVVDGDSYRLASNVVVYLLKDNGDVDEKGKTGHIEDYKYFKAIVDEEDKDDGKIVVVTLSDELDDDSDEDEVKEGEITSIKKSGDKLLVVIDKKGLEIDNRILVTIENEKGKEIDQWLGLDEVYENLEKGMVAEDIEFDKNDDRLILEFTIVVDEDAVDKSDLEDLIEDAEDLDEDDYTADSWEDLEDALEEAKDVMDEDDATEEEVEEAIEALEEAMENLDRVAGENEIEGEYQVTMYGARVNFDMPEGEDEIEEVVVDGESTDLFSVDGSTGRVLVDEEPDEIVVTIDGTEYTIVIK